MEGIYDIFRGTEKIGKAEVRREGLYYRFRCCCNLTGEVMYRITVTCGEKTENLGIPAPEGKEFYLLAKLPVRRFLPGIPHFRAVPRHPQMDGKLWVPISPETPFAYITRLQNAVFAPRGEEAGLLISKEVPQDSDPNP